MSPSELFIKGNDPGHVLPSQNNGNSSSSEAQNDGHLVCSKLEAFDKPRDEELSENRKLSKIMGMLHNSAVNSILQIFKWLPKRKSKVTTKNSQGSKGKGRMSHMINGKEIIGNLKALSFGSKELDSGRYTNASAMSSPYRSEFCKQKAGVIERDASVSDAIAHCRLSLDGANKL